MEVSSFLLSMSANVLPPPPTPLPLPNSDEMGAFEPVLDVLVLVGPSSVRGLCAQLRFKKEGAWAHERTFWRCVRLLHSLQTGGRHHLFSCQVWIPRRMSAFPASLLARSVVASSAPVQHHRQHHRQQHQQLPPPPFVPPLRSVMPAGKTPSSPPLISLSSSSSSSSLSSSSSSSVVAFAEDSSRKKQRVDSLDGSLAHQPPPPPQQQQQQQQQQPEQLHKRPRVDSSDPTRSPAVSSPGPAAAGVENSLVTKLLDTVHKFREAEREFWRQQQQLEASSKRMGELCTEIEMLAVKLGQPTTAATAPASSSAPGTPNTSTTASSAPSSPEQSHKRSNGALWAPAEDSEVEDVITPIYQQRHQQQPAPPVQAMSSPPPSAQQHQNPNARWPLRRFSHLNPN